MQTVDLGAFCLWGFRIRDAQFLIVQDTTARSSTASDVVFFLLQVDFQIPTWQMQQVETVRDPSLVFILLMLFLPLIFCETSGSPSWVSMRPQGSHSQPSMKALGLHTTLHSVKHA